MPAAAPLPPVPSHAGCPLCDAAGGVLVARTPELRVIRTAEEAGFPAFYRVIWNTHVAEFSDLPAPQRARCMDAVAAVEHALRTALAPAKINLAAFGNLVPHLHWHVIARFAWDSHYPAPLWAAPRRPAPAAELTTLAARLPALDAAVANAISAAADMV